MMHRALTFLPMDLAGSQTQQAVPQHSLAHDPQTSPHTDACDPCGAHSLQFTLTENFGFSLYPGPQLLESFDCLNNCS